MSIGFALVTLRLNRFEVISAVAISIAAGLGAIAIMAQLAGVAMPTECRTWLGPGWTEAPSGCQPIIERYQAILTPQGQDLFRVMGLFPFVVGILAAAPIVARELEAGTAHTAWSLFGSRVRWLGLQVWPVAASVTSAVAFAAITAELVAREMEVLGQAALPLLGLHGIPVLARLLAAFGIALFAGSIVARTLPALVIAAVCCAVLFLGVSQAQETWIRAQAPLPRMDGETRIWAYNGTWRWVAPDGRFLNDAEVSALVPDALEEADAELVQPVNTMEWLGERGYTSIPMGIPEAQAVGGWYPFDLLIHAAAGIGATVAAFVVVNRRRP